MPSHFKKWIAIGILLIVVTVIDLAVVLNNSFPLGYILAGWTLVWLLCFLILKSWLLSIAVVMVLSVIEDALFIITVHVANGQPIYPFYCHEWMWGLSWDWLGIPSHYFILLGIVGILVFISTKVVKR